MCREPDDFLEVDGRPLGPACAAEMPDVSFDSPFSIGCVAIPNRVVLAPMAGLTNSAYRRHMKAHGAGLVITEMVSAYGLLYGNERTQEYLGFAEEERPVAVQLFAGDPDVMGRAAEAVLARLRPPDIIDINMGCPVRKVLRTGAGAALLGDPGRAAGVAASVVGAASQAGVPVTVKLRSGLREGEVVAVELARRLEQAGVAALGVHPRAASQFYQGQADHRVTAQVAAAVSIPVVASGDIRSVEAAGKVLQETGAAAVMAARGAAGRPWLLEALLGRRPDVRPSRQEAVADLRRLLSLAAQDMGAVRAARWSRKLLGWYLKPVGVPTPAIEALRHVPDALALDAALRELQDSCLPDVEESARLPLTAQLKRCTVGQKGM